MEPPDFNHGKGVRNADFFQILNKEEKFLKKKDMKFKEIELLVFNLKPEISISPHYVNTRSTAEAIGFLNFLSEQRGNRNMYVLANFTLVIGGKEIVLRMTKKSLAGDNEQLFLKAKERYCLEKLIEKIENFNRKKLWTNSRKAIEKMEFLSDVYI